MSKLLSAWLFLNLLVDVALVVWAFMVEFGGESIYLSDLYLLVYVAILLAAMNLLAAAYYAAKGP